MGYISDVSKADRTAEAVDFPEVILIDNCSACNLKCSMCDHENVKLYRKIQIMDMGLYKKIIDEIAVENPSARVWEIFFGEPFLCQDIDERIRYAKEKGLTDVVLNSNGILMTRDKARKVIEAGLDAMYVGVDAATDNVYEKIRIKGNLSNVVRNVLQYRDLLCECGNSGQKIFVQFVVSETNEHELDDFKTFWEQEGVSVKIRPKVSWAGLIEASNLQENKQVNRKPCYWLMRNISICADGQVALCSVDIHCRVKCGNVKDHTIKELWHGKLKEYRAMHRDGRFHELPNICKDCSDWQSTYAEYCLL
jgi:radical SAM protein with 4Fe4S-binding SPASM domain